MNFLGNKRTNVDAIINHLKNEEKTSLTPKQQEVMKHMMEADRLLYQYKDTPTVIKFMQAKFPGMSHTTAWRMIQFAEYAFGPLRRVEKDYGQRMFIDDLWKEIEIMKANRPKYHRTIASLYKIILDAYGFKYDNEIIDPESLKPHTNVAVFVFGKKAVKLNIDDMDNVPMEERMKIMNELEEQKNFAQFEEVEGE